MFVVLKLSLHSWKEVYTNKLFFLCRVPLSEGASHEGEMLGQGKLKKPEAAVFCKGMRNICDQV